MNLIICLKGGRDPDSSDMVEQQERTRQCRDGKNVILSLHHNVALIVRPDGKEDYQTLVGMATHHASFRCEGCTRNFGCILLGITSEESVALFNKTQNTATVARENFESLTLDMDVTQIPKIEGFIPGEPQIIYPSSSDYISTRPDNPKKEP